MSAMTEWIDKMAYDADVADLSALLAQHKSAIAKWKVYSNDLNDDLALKTSQCNSLASEVNALRARLASSESELASLQMKNRQLEHERDEMVLANMQNYTEKKIFMTYAQFLREATNIVPSIDPVFYNGDKGIWIRERVREVVKKVYDVGGSLDDAVKAGFREFLEYTTLPVPGKDRATSNMRERWALVASKTGHTPKSAAGPVTEEEKELLKNCKDLEPHGVRIKFT